MVYFRFFENPRGEIFGMGKNPRWDSENPRGEIFSLHGLANPAGILTFVMEYFLGHYRFQIKKP